MKKLLFAFLIPSLAYAVAPNSGVITFYQNSGQELGSTQNSGNPGGAGTGFMQMLRGPSSVGVGQTFYSPMGDGDIEVTVSTTNESVMLEPYYTPGTATSLWVKVLSNSLTQGATVALRINGADGNNVAYIPAGQTGEFKGSGSVSDSIHVGTTVDMAIHGPTSGTGTLAVYNAAIVFTPVTNNMMKFVAAGGMSAPSTNGFAIYYFGVAGTNLMSDQTETNGPNTIIPLAGTFQNFCVGVGTNTLNATQTARFRHNLANGNMVISIPANATGTWCDNTNTDAVVAGDTVDYYYNMGNTGNAGSTGLWWMSVEYVTTGKSTVYLEENTGHTNNVNGTQYSAIQGALSWDTESNMKVLSQVPGTFSKMGVHVASNSDGITVPVSFRNNGTSGSETLSIGAGTSGFFVCNSTQTDHVATTDEPATQITTDANGITIDYYDWVFTHD